MQKNNLIKQFSKYVSLNVLAMISLSFYILADTFFVSKGVGIDGLTSLNLALPIFSFVSGLGLMIGIGGATVFSIAKARGNEENAKNTFALAMLFGAVLSIILVIIGLLLNRQLAIAFGAKEHIIANTAIYIKYIMIFAPAFIFNNILIAFIKNNGRPTLAMFAMIVGSLTNVFLDYLFIFPFKMGMLGAVVATGLAPVLSLITISPFLIKDRKTLGLVMPKRAIAEGKQIVKLGMPSLISELSSGIVVLIFNYMILKISGNVGVAAYGVIANISLVCISIFTGLAQGSQPLLSQCFGSSQLKNVKQIKTYASFLAVAIGVLLYSIVLIFKTQIINIFNVEQISEFTQIASLGIIIYFIGLPFVGLNIITAMSFSSTNCAKPAFIIAICRGLVLIITAVLILGNCFGLIGIWIALPVAEILTTIISLILMRKTKISIANH